MKNIIKVLSMLIILLHMSMPICTAKMYDIVDGRYKEMHRSENLTIYIDMFTTHHYPTKTNYNFYKAPVDIVFDEGHIDAWVKLVFSEEMAEKIKLAEKAAGNSSNLDGLSYALQRVLVRTNKNSSNTLQSIYYSANGIPIQTYTSATGWIDAIPESVAESICTSVLFYQIGVYSGNQYKPNKRM